MAIGPRALGTTIRWASLLAPGYCVPTRPDIHEFVGFGPNDHVVDLAFGSGSHYVDRVCDALVKHGLPIREQWTRFEGPHDPMGPVVFCPRSSTPYKDWPRAHWDTLLVALREQGYLVERETQGDLWELEKQLRRARWVVGVDTGSLHLADYMGIPVVGLYGYTSPKIHGPRGKLSRSLYEFKGVACITPEQVLHELLALDRMLTTDPAL